MIATAPQCCCDCPTKEDTGLPDTINVGFNILSSDDEGIPSDIEGTDCGGESAYTRFEFSAALMELLQSMEFAFDEAAVSTICGVCCFNYHATGDYEPCDPPDAGPFFLLGPSPFSPVAYGEGYTRIRFKDPVCRDNTGTPVPWSDCVEDCGCDIAESADELCGTGDTITNGTLAIPQPIYGSAELTICVEGYVVTICLTVRIWQECRIIVADDCTYETGAACGDIDPVPINASAGCSVGCADSCSGVDSDTCTLPEANVVTFSLSQTQDLSSGSGTVWERIKAASWSDEFEQLLCNCDGDACADSLTDVLCVCRWDIAAVNNCSTSPGEPAEDPEGQCAGIVTEDAPIDLDCIYAIGEMGVTFAD